MPNFLDFLIPLLTVGIGLAVLFQSGINDIKQDVRGDRNTLNGVQQHVSDVEVELKTRLGWIEGFLMAQSKAPDEQTYKFRAFGGDKL